MPAFGEITPQQLLRKIGTPDCPPIFDCRTPEDITLDPTLIPSTQIHSFSKETASEAAHDAGAAILYCQKGKKLSQGLAALWRNQGLKVEVLSGGHKAWLAQGLPTLSLDPIHTLGTTPTRWVTRQRPKIDRIACPWLIRRFIDPRAEFLFVPATDVALVAEKFDAQAFDMPEDQDLPDAWSHQGNNCTFDTLLQRFDLNFAPLQTMARVIRAADTNQNALAPEAAGLLALSVGLSRQYRDDAGQLAAGLGLYDMLFRWARDGQDEQHVWEGAK